METVVCFKDFVVAQAVSLIEKSFEDPKSMLTHQGETFTMYPR
jgi:hypothetical protein